MQSNNSNNLVHLKLEVRIEKDTHTFGKNNVWAHHFWSLQIDTKAKDVLYTCWHVDRTKFLELKKISSLQGGAFI